MSPEIFRDNTVLAKAGRFEVLRECQRIALGLDEQGECIGIHIVRQNGHEAMYLRAVQHGDALLVVFDLRDVQPELDAIRSYHALDVPGVIKHTLRLAYRDRDQLMAAMLAHPQDVLTIDPAAAHAPEMAAA